jgi:uncharacterized membrane protein
LKKPRGSKGANFHTATTILSQRGGKRRIKPMDTKEYPPPIVAILIVLVMVLAFWFLLNPLTQSQHRVIETTAETLVKYLGRFHPIVVHFPIAFIFGTILLEVLGSYNGSKSFASLSRVLLIMGVLGAVIAIPLGFAAIAEYGEDSLIYAHKWVALGSFLTMLVAASIREAVERKYLRERWLVGYRIFLLLTTLLIGWAGYLGGEMVHGVGHLSWPS